jgi:hypothetical protein
VTTVPTLGWGVLAWLMHHLPSPRDETQPYQPADWQARRTLRWYELEPSGKRLWNRVHDEDPKGKGKSPHAGATAICEFRGPVVFDGWARQGDVYACGRHGCRCGWEYPYEPGEPKGRPWGSPGLPSPWVQVAAVSEAQTANTWAALHAFLPANDGRLAEWLRLDAGRTLVYWRDRVDAKIERVTSSAASRNGQPITHAVMDEPQEWTPELRGKMLADTILENLTKLDGWAHFTGNAPVLGRESVAELLRDPSRRSLHLGPRPSIEPREDMTRDELRPLVREVYEDTPWTPVDRILDDIEDRAAHPWSSSLRLFLNTPLDAGVFDAWMDAGAWADCDHPELELDPARPTFAVVRIAHDHRFAAVAVAQRHGDHARTRCRMFDDLALVDDDALDLAPVERYLEELRRTFRSEVMTSKRFSPKGKEYLRPAPGPSVAYNGAFFARSAQLLQGRGLVMVDLPNTPARIGPAAETLMGMVLGHQLEHDGDPELATQMTSLVGRETNIGWTLAAGPELRPGVPRRVEGALATVLVVHRAMTEKLPGRHTVRGIA